MKCKSKADNGYFRLNDKGKWVKVNAPVQDTLPFEEQIELPLPSVGVGKEETEC